MLPRIPAVLLGLILPNDTIISLRVSGRFISRLGAFVCINEQNSRANSRAHRTHTARQQRKNVEQASASSGNQCFLGHHSVPRFELYAFDDSTNGGRAMLCVLAQQASAITFNL